MHLPPSLRRALTSDIEGTARPFSHWVRTSPTADTVAADAAAAVAAAKTAPGRHRVTDSCRRRRLEPRLRTVRPRPSPIARRPPTARPADSVIDAAAAMLRSEKNVGLVLGRALPASSHWS